MILSIAAKISGISYVMDAYREEAEAMLEALVMLLPPEHRIEYGG